MRRLLSGVKEVSNIRKSRRPIVFVIGLLVIAILLVCAVHVFYRLYVHHMIEEQSRGFEIVMTTQDSSIEQG